MRVSHLCAVFGAALPLPLSTLCHAQTFARIADTTTPVPGGSGAFTSFDPSVVAASFFPVTREVTFRAFGAGQEGIYYFDGANLTRVADRNTAVPGTTGTFETFDTPAGVGGATFKAVGAGRHGIYAGANNTVKAIDSSPISQSSYGRVSAGYGVVNAYRRNGQVVVDGGTGSINFTPSGFTFVSPSGDPDVGVFDVFVRADFFGPTSLGTGVFMGGSNFPAPALVFDAGTGGQMDDVSAGLGGTVASIIRGGPSDGIRWAQPRGSSDGSFPEGLIPRSTSIPGGTGSFTNFRTVAAGGLENVIPSQLSLAFLGEGSGNQLGIYWADRAFGVHKLIARGDALDGRTVQSLDLGRDGASAEVVAFHATFTDGSSGVYYAVVPESSATVLLVGSLVMMRRRHPR
jgi:hypothetical protein